MYRTNCAKCGTVYTVTPCSNAAFCKGCLLAMQGECREIERHNAAIKAGDVNEVPQNDREHREVRQAIKRRLNTEPDTRLSTWRDDA